MRNKKKFNEFMNKTIDELKERRDGFSFRRMQLDVPSKIL